MAHQIGIRRAHTYELVVRLKLWPVVNAARVARVESDRRAAEQRRLKRGSGRGV